MNKYDFMDIEDMSEQMGTIYLEGDTQEILPLLNEIIDRCNQLKLEIMEGNRG
jgi:hypothetical protein